MKKLKFVCGSALVLLGVGLVSIGGYLFWINQSWSMFGLFVILASFGLLIVFTGVDLARGKSIKDDLFYIFFN